MGLVTVTSAILTKRHIIEMIRAKYNNLANVTIDDGCKGFCAKTIRNHLLVGEKR